MPSSFSRTSTPTSSQSTVPATPMTPTPSTSTAPAPNPAPGLPPINTRDTGTDQTNKWVISLSKTPITTEQLSLLQKVPNFAIIPKYPPKKLASQLENRHLPNFQPRKQMSSDLTSTNYSNSNKSHHNNQCNLNPTQHRALTQLKQDNSRMVLTADKGVAMVIMDQEDYTNKAQTLLQDTNTYKGLKKDPTSQLKNKLISLLKDIKQTGGLSTNKYKQLYPTGAVPQSVMAFPKYIK